MSLPNDKPAPTLSEFLIARLAEVAQAAAHAKWAMQGLWYEDADDRVDEFVRMMSPDRVLVDVDAKLQIIALHTEGGGGWDPSCVDEDEPVCLGEIRKCRTLHALALPYAGHPDYRQEWAV